MSVPFTLLKLLRNGLIGAALAWAATLPLATLAAVQPHPAAWVYLFALSVYSIGAVVCHQLDARSFHLWAHQMPVCARCTGIYAGAALAMIATLWREPRPGARAVHPRWILGLAMLPALATLVFEWTTGVTPSNVTRAATGVILGAAAGWLIREIN